MSGSEPLTCAKLRNIATANNLFGCSRVLLRMADGTPLVLSAVETVAPSETDEATGKPKLTGEPVLFLTVERQYP
jgi:hypothetical protein